jgi:hypothetical protein
MLLPEMLGGATRQILHGKLISCVQYSLNSSLLDHCVSSTCPDVNMECTMEQRVNVKFCVKLQKLQSETLEMLMVNLL